MPISVREFSHYQKIQSRQQKARTPSSQEDLISFQIGLNHEEVVITKEFLALRANTKKL